MHPAIQSRLPELEALCRRHHVRRLALFGSALRDDFDAERSDLDVLVDFQEGQGMAAFHNYFALMEQLRGLFGRDVDLVSWKSIKNPYFREEVESSHRVVYAA